MIILIRHGQSTTNAERLLVGRSDPHLTPLGERQSLALAPYLGGVRDVWVSPLARARQTAALALPNLEARVKESFVEVDYGDLDGQPVSTITFEGWRAFEHDHDVAFGGGESLASVDQRVHEELDALLRDESSLLHAHDRHLAIVSHVSPIKSAVVWALGVTGSTAWRTRLDNGSITTIGLRGATPQLVRFNVVPALEESA
ncbi:MAG TPA: histidine phosphatase family protein [Acidimicrobiales bacterium]|nr:histidine phosphatase family protein [Acidimicrobiales bacterium]